MKEARSEYTAMNAQMEAVRAISKISAVLTLTMAQASYATLEITLVELLSYRPITTWWVAKNISIDGAQTQLYCERHP